MQSHRRTQFLVLLGVTLLAAALLGYQRLQTPSMIADTVELQSVPQPPYKLSLNMISPSSQPSASTVMEGEKLSLEQCSVCHLRPTPDALRKESWDELFSKKLLMLSFIDALDRKLVNVAPPREPGFGVRTKPFPDYRVSLGDWEKIIYYYLAASPATEPAQSRMPVNLHTRAPFLLRFGQMHVEKNAQNPNRDSRGEKTQQFVGSFAGIDGQQIILGLDHKVDVLDNRGQLRNSVKLSGVPTGFQRKRDGFYLTLMGNTLFPTEASDGRLVKLPLSALGNKPAPHSEVTVLDALYRPIRTTLADLDGDKTDELLVEEFGFSRGGLNLYRPEKGKFNRTPIFAGTGVVGSVITDVDGDKLPDIAFLISQATETLLIARNQGDSRYTSTPVFTAPPTYGFNSLTSGDVDGDGDTDLVTTNGDNFELRTYPLKPYHGIRIFENQGMGRFQESYFFPMYGATQSIVADFDDDGDNDIVAISFFPNFSQRPFETAVYLENQGSMNFTPRGIVESAYGRWLTMGSGDFDGDGDIDLVFAAAYYDSFEGQWNNRHQGDKRYDFAIYENTTR